jgi:hypothetical protein
MSSEKNAKTITSHVSKTNPVKAYTRTIRTEGGLKLQKNKNKNTFFVGMLFDDY